MTVALEYLRDGGDVSIALRAAFLALSPRLESSRGSATGGSLILRHGSLPASDSVVSEMLRLWKKVRQAIPDLNRETWRELANSLHWWIYPELPHVAGRRPSVQRFHRVARQIVMDLVPFAKGHPGLGSALRERAEILDLDLELEVDPVFELLYPRIDHSRDPEAWHKRRREAEEAARKLAREWAGRPIGEVLADLARYAEEAKWQDSSWGTVFMFEQALAEASASPQQEVVALLEGKASPSLVRFFLSRVVHEQRPRWKQLLGRCLGTPEYSWVATEHVLRLESPPEELLSVALGAAEPQQVETACLRGEVPTSTVLRLLASTDPRLAVAAAVGEWLSEPREDVRPEVRSMWRETLLSPGVRALDAHPHEQYWLGAILSKDANLALDWLRAGFSADRSQHFLRFTQRDLDASAVRALDSAQRARLLDELPPQSSSESLLRQLVGDSPDLFERLLDRADLRRDQLAPLTGKPPDTEWNRLARLALEAGHSPREIAEESLFPVGVYSPSVEHYAKWVKAFRRLSESKHAGLREVARHGLQKAERLVEDAQREQRQVELTGFH